MLVDRVYLHCELKTTFYWTSSGDLSGLVTCFPQAHLFTSCDLFRETLVMNELLNQCRCVFYSTIIMGWCVCLLCDSLEKSALIKNSLSGTLARCVKFCVKCLNFRINIPMWRRRWRRIYLIFSTWWVIEVNIDSANIRFSRLRSICQAQVYLIAFDVDGYYLSHRVYFWNWKWNNFN